MLKNIFAIAAISLTFGLQNANAAGLDFKGIEVEAIHSLEEVERTFGVRCGVGAANMQVCNGGVTVATAPAQMNLVVDANGRVQRIALSFNSRFFDGILPALLEKYGPPSQSQQSTVQNNLGASFPQQQFLWELNGTYLEAYRVYGTIDQSYLRFFGPTDEAMRAELSRAKANDL